MRSFLLLIRNKAFLIILIIILAFISLTVVWMNKDKVAILTRNIKWQGKEIEFGLNFANYPLAYSDNNFLKGFAVDFLEKLNAENNFILKLYPAPADPVEIYDELLSGVYDIALVNKSFLNNEQLKKVYISLPFFTSRQCLIMRSGENLPDRDIEMRAGEAYHAPFNLSLLNYRSLGIQKGTLGKKVSEQLIANKKVEGVFLAEFDNTKKLFDALLNKTVDAIISDLPCKQKTSWPLWKKITVQYDYLSYEEYVFIVKRSDPALRKLIDSKFKESKESGMYEELYFHWFG